jgi:predicted permease
MDPRRWFYALPLRLRALFRRNQLERELDEELRLHLELEIESAIDRGLNPEAARAHALRRLHGIEFHKEECRDTWGVRFLDGLLQDARYALRNLRKSPAFALVAVASLSLGIGANTAVFSLMNVLLIRPLPVPRPGELALVNVDSRMYSFSHPLFLDIERRNSVFSGTFAYTTRSVQLQESEDMLLVPATYASGSYFATLAVQPAIGRVFGPEDDAPNGGVNGPVAVISDGFWTRRFGRNPSTVGQSIVLNGVSVNIIGVMPASFFGAEVGSASDIWMPLTLSRQLGDNLNCLNSPTCTFLHVLGRVRPGVSLAQANAGLGVISRAAMEATLAPAMRADRKAIYLARTIHAEPGRSGYTSLRFRLKNPLEILMALVGIVLLIACANMANLLTARASARSREVGVRLAMGAGRLRIVRQFLTESVVLAAAGAVGGLLFSIWSTRILVGVLSTAQNPVELNLHPDWRVLLFTVAAAVGAGILFGIGPALRATRHSLSAGLKERAASLRGGESSFGFGRALLGIQVALSVILLAAAGLFAGTLYRLITLDPGFDPARITVISVVNSRPPVLGAAAIDLFGTLMRRARAIPGVESATVLSTTPLTNSGWDQAFSVPGRPDLTEEQRIADINAVGTQFSKTTGIPILAGRDFNDGDTAQSEKVVLISENAARRWFPTRSAVGEHVGLEPGGPRRIVGVVGNTKYLNLREELPLTVYVPYTQSTQGGYIALRTSAPVRAVLPEFRRILREEAPRMPVATIKTMRQQVDESLATERLTAYLSVFIGILALLLTSVGLYGVLAYLVARRTSEIGIRMALGAQRPVVVWLVVREAMAHTLFGIAAGVAVVLATSKVLRSLLFDLRPNDPPTILGSVGLLAFVCCLAAGLPARRATRLDPMQALREE